MISYPTSESAIIVLFKNALALCKRFAPKRQLSNLFTWPIHFIINPVEKNKLSCYTPHRRSTTVSLEPYPLYASLKEQPYRPSARVYHNRDLEY